MLASSLGYTPIAHSHRLWPSLATVLPSAGHPIQQFAQPARVFLGRQGLRFARVEPHPAAAGAAVDADLLVEDLPKLAAAFRAPHVAQIEDRLLQLLLIFLSQPGDELAILLGEVDILPGALDTALELGVLVEFAPPLHAVCPPLYGLHHRWTYRRVEAFTPAQSRSTACSGGDRCSFGSPSGARDSLSVPLRDKAGPHRPR
jgi:hypothetical protein